MLLKKYLKLDAFTKNLGWKETFPGTQRKRPQTSIEFEKKFKKLSKNVFCKKIRESKKCWKSAANNSLNPNSTAKQLNGKVKSISLVENHTLQLSLFFLICAILYDMEAKSSTHMAHIRRFFTRCLPIALMLKTMLAEKFTLLNVKIVFHHSVENLL